MPTTTSSAYTAVRIEGGLIPGSLLSRLAQGNAGDVPGLTSADYGLAAGESVREAANRVWAYLTTAWAGYRNALALLPEGDRATTLTRDRWIRILLEQLGYGRIAPTPAGGITADGKQYPVSHLWESVPIHVLGARIDLDKRAPGVAGAASQAPQSMMQELLNRSDGFLWAIVTNGLVLRLLRDSTSLVGSAYVEFDLEAIFDGELFSDFLLLYTLCHATRLEARDPEIGAASCWLEQWRTLAIESGTRALDQLRDGVLDAIRILGTGFLTNPSNSSLRKAVDSGALTLRDFNHALLRVVYRLLFTFVIEDRGILLSPDATPAAKQRYAEYFSTDRLRRIARKRAGGRHGDRWAALQLVWDGLGTPGGRPEIGLDAIGGLFERGHLDVLAEAELSNEALLAAVRALSLVTEPGSGKKRIVDYRSLDSEELGSIYESLLEYVPRWSAPEATYSLENAAGNSRKTTGSYYTPTSLVESLLASTLDPVLDAAEQRGRATGDVEAALLDITVCDPACGSGHFLVAAARRIAKRVAAVRTGDPEPPPAKVREALRDVIDRCVYGVDLNPLAVELAKVSLWLEAVVPGRPLAFLDAQIKVGNSLVGATPALLNKPLPEDAFKPIEGDDKKIATAAKARNKKEIADTDVQGSLFDDYDFHPTNESLAQAASAAVRSGLTLEDIHVQQQRLRDYLDSSDYLFAKLHADAWCAAFVWPKVSGGVECPTTATLAAIRDGKATEAVADEAERLASEYRFFHWHLEFPHIFPTEPTPKGGSVNPTTGWYGGFDVVLANPPWERVKIQEQEFFASRDPEIANAANAAARKRLIRKLPDTNPALFDEFNAAKRKAEGESHLLRNSGRFPLTGRGDINTYAAFSEGNRSLISGTGRMGIIIPTGIATDATTQYFFKDLVTSSAIVSLYDFENRSKLFDIDSRFKFCLMTLVGRDERSSSAQFAFFAHDPVDLDREGVRYTLTPEEITLLNPNTGTCPVFRSRRDAEITLGIYRRVPVLINENDPENGNPWGISFLRMFDMSNDSHLFHTREELEDDGWVLNGNVFERPLDPPEISGGG